MNKWHRAIKITLSATTSVFIAQLLGLKNPYSAGIIALLSIFDTKQDSVQNAIARIKSTALAFTIAVIVFKAFGFTIPSFGIYLILYSVLAYQFNVEAGLSPCSVLVTHFLIAESVSWKWVVNEVALMLIGVAVALLYNLWMPSHASQVEKNVDLVEVKMRDVLYGIASYLVNNEKSGQEKLREKLKTLEKSINELNEIALLEHKNHLADGDDYYLRYCQMRQEQTMILHNIIDTFDRLELSTQANEMLSALFRRTADEFDESNTGIELLNALQELYQYFRESKLPETRSEFESRALLYNVLIDLENFLSVKRDFYLEVNQQN